MIENIMNVYTYVLETYIKLSKLICQRKQYTYVDYKSCVIKKTSNYNNVNLCSPFICICDTNGYRRYLRKNEINSHIDDIPILKSKNHPFVFMAIEFENNKTIDIYDEVKKYFIIGNKIDKELIKFIVRDQFDITLVNFKTKILNKDVTFETLNDDFCFDIK